MHVRLIAGMLRIVPLDFAEARAFVSAHHRHHQAPRLHKFSIGCKDGAGKLVGVCICARPIATWHDIATRLEVKRLCTDGTANACSILYAAAARAARAMGYTAIGTYIRADESGVSLRAAGWKLAHRTGIQSWNQGKRRRRIDQTELIERQYWEKLLD